MEIPVACTLSAGEVADRAGEWRHFFASSIESAQIESAEVERSHLRLRLKHSPEVLPIAVDLAQREIDCCAFFEFSIVMRSDSYWLIMGVPRGAEGMLHDFARLLPVDVVTSVRADDADDR